MVTSGIISIRAFLRASASLAIWYPWSRFSICTARVAQHSDGGWHTSDDGWHSTALVAGAGWSRHRRLGSGARRTWPVTEGALRSNPNAPPCVWRREGVCLYTTVRRVFSPSSLSPAATRSLTTASLLATRTPWPSPPSPHARGVLAESVRALRARAPGVCSPPLPPCDARCRPPSACRRVCRSLMPSRRLSAQTGAVRWVFGQCTSGGSGRCALVMTSPFMSRVPGAPAPGSSCMIAADREACAAPLTTAERGAKPWR